MAAKEWISAHKALVAIFVLVILGYFFISTFLGIGVSSPAKFVNPTVGSPQMDNFNSASFGSAGLSMAPSISLERSASPVSNSTERMVINNSTLSLLVKDVREAGDKVLAYAKDSGGFMITTSYNRPNESPFATITVRIPSAKFDASLNYFRSLGMKVTNENLIGEDITDKFVDIEARIETLARTKAKFEAIMESAITVQEILSVQREITNLQTQIDNLKGQQQLIEQNVSLSKITVYLSTDELALPYTPDQTFRPNVIFKLAVRSLLNTLRVLGEAVIWIAVYAVIWVPVLIIYLLVKRWRRNKNRPI